jgi:hypothetical protein
MTKPLLVLTLFVGTVVHADSLLSVACTTQSLAAYVGLGPSGCDISPIPRDPGFLNFKDFGFTVLASGGGVIPISASDIQLSPLDGHTGFGFNVTAPNGSGTKFSVTGTQFVQYQITYTIDPLGPRPLPRLLNMRRDPTVAPGNATVTVNYCVGAAFGISGCPTLDVVSFHVTDLGTSSTLLAEASLPGGVTVFGVQEIIDLNGHGTGTAEFGSFRDVNIPEPRSIPLLAIALLCLWQFSRRRPLVHP